MGETGDEIKSGAILGRGAERNYIASPNGEAAEAYLISELETAGIHARMVWDVVRKTWNTCNAHALDQKWGNHLGLIIAHLQDDLTYLEAEIKKIRDSSKTG